MKRWLVLSASIIGIAALAALIWFVFPLVAVAGVTPFESLWLRLALIVFVLAVFFGYHAWRFHKRRKASAAIATKLTENISREPDSDARQLSERMTDALQTLRKSHKSRGDFLYELPWYIIIGPPGAGKTTALLNSGLKFPLASAAGTKPVAGTGGTRYCDWWFTEEAVLIDTAGRYTTQDSDASADRLSWLAFLDLLKTNRPLQPINGVMVAISLEDLMSLSGSELAAHCTAIRKRLAELHQQLSVDYPVYVLFTKADLVAGFMEYFGNLGEQRRKAVWGATFQVKDKTENKVSEAEAELDLLIGRLSQEMPDRLQEEVDPVARVRLFGFPSQMAALKRPIVEFLNQIFEPTRYHTNIPLRGFYFTSGTQEGTPIDRLLGAMTGAFDRQGAGPQMSGRGKSFFLGDLLTKVIFGEAGWVSTNRAAQRRKAVLRYGAYAATALIAFAILGAWWISYLSNSKLIDNTDYAAADYKRIAGELVSESTVADSDFEKPLQLLSYLRDLEVGYGKRDLSAPPRETFGLSQRDRLLSASTEAYRVALERTLRSRLILHVEKQLELNRNRPEFIYEALKVYLMLSVAGIDVDNDLVKAWMGHEWDQKNGSLGPQARLDFMAHLDAMLALDTGAEGVVSPNGALIEDSQRILAQMSLADRAYALLKSSAVNADVSEAVDWTAADAGGADAGTVFETADGAGLETIRVDRLFTYGGFHNLFLGRIGSIADQLEQESWVLGKFADKEAIKTQYKSLGPAMVEKYGAEFVREWQVALSKLRMKPLAADKTEYAVLRAISAPTSPLKELLGSISYETKLTEEPPEPEAAEGGAVTSAAAEVIAKKLQSKMTGLARVGLDIARKSELRASGGAAQSQIPGKPIEAQFRRFHEFVEGAEGDRPIDVLLANLNGIFSNLEMARNDPANAASAMQVVQQQVAALRGQNASRLPEPFAEMMLSAANEFESEATNTSIAELNAQLRNEVTAKCTEFTTNRFPFSPKGKREVPWPEFARLFQPGGIIDGFFTSKLDAMVDRGTGQWKWKQNTKLGRELSQGTLKQFQNAEKIRDTFFATGGQVPNVILTVTPLTLSSNATAVEFEVNGVKLEAMQSIETPKEFNWPGNLSGGTASVNILPEIDGVKSTIALDGAWALYRLLLLGSISQKGDRMFVRFVIGGREASFEIKVGSLENPFLLPALRNFTCPKEL